MSGFLLMWPTLLTLIMFPILLLMYHRLGKSEENTMIKEFGKKYETYKQNVPAYIPKLSSTYSKQNNEG